MFAHLTGRLAEVGPDEVVLDVGGVGYGLSVSGATASRLPQLGEQVTLFAHHLVRDERMVLFGFASREERELFLSLCGVSKIGPSTALSLLSALDPGRLADAVEAGDVGLLAKVKGIGKRTAERLCVELRGRLTEGAALPGAVTDRAAAVASALCALGYPRKQAAQAAVVVTAEAPDDVPLDELVKRGLGAVGKAGG